MESAAHMSDLASVSFVDFGAKASSKRGEAPSEGTSSCFDYDYGSKYDITLDLSLGQKTDNLFVADQTPTPTRLLKNCDEVGLFEDLRHVNPFDIGFQRAAEQNAAAGQSQSTPVPIEATLDDDSLHTPQVYPLESSNAAASEFHRQAKAPGHNNNSSPLELPIVDELLTTTTPKALETQATNSTTTSISSGTVLPAASIQLLQPQIFTLVLPPQGVAANNLSVEPAKLEKQIPSAIPVQTVRPFILPKPKSSSAPTNAVVAIPAITSKANQTIIMADNMPATAHEPSSASLTPTSQLPIKERLKAILNSNNINRQKQNSFAAPVKAFKAKPNRNEDCMERRRAAASRYRNKMRNEHRDLKQHNTQLKLLNSQLQERINALEHELHVLKQQHKDGNSASVAVMPNHIQIPPSSIHLVINVPKMIVPSNVCSNSNC